MKFYYEYRNSANERCRGEISASSRDSVYRELKKLGIRPSRVELAPGFVNKLRSLGWRWLFIVILLVAVLMLGFFSFSQGDKVRAGGESIDEKISSAPVAAVFESMTRRQVIGDAVEIERGIRTGWANVFPEEGERFLASFAIPGVEAGVKNTDEGKLRESLDRQITLKDDDSLEARQIKSIVEGMKNELRSFVSAGGSLKEYGIRLVQRQEQEIAIYNRAVNELTVYEKSDVSPEEYMAIWEKRNMELRRMGIRQIPYSRDMLSRGE